jgi:hypothetical protein
VSIFKALYVDAIKSWARMPMIEAETSVQLAVLVMARWLFKVGALIALTAICLLVLVGAAWGLIQNPAENWVLFLFVYAPVAALIVQNIYLSRKY